MADFCTKCGAKQKEGAKFCPFCGASLKDSVKETAVKAAGGAVLKTAATKALRLVKNNTDASGVPGETLLTGTVPGSISKEVAGVAGPLMVIAGGLKSLLSGFRGALKDKKKLVPAIILALSWLLLTLLPALGFNPFPIKLLSFLTFAQGGMSNNIFRLFGGIVGKTIFAAFVFTLFSGGNPVKKIKGYYSSFAASLKTKNTLKVPTLLLGIGCALLFFNFIVGAATPWSFMAGAATIYLSLKAAGGGFLRRLIQSVFVKFSKGKSGNSISVFMSGLTLGFTSTTVVALLNLAKGPLAFGIFAVMVSALWFLLVFLKNKSSRKEEVAKQ